MHTYKIHDCNILQQTVVFCAPNGKNQAIMLIGSGGNFEYFSIYGHMLWRINSPISSKIKKLKF